MLVVASISACATSTGQAMLTHVWEAPAYILTAICQGLTLLLLSSNACNSDVLIGLGGRKLKPSVDVFSCSRYCTLEYIQSSHSYYAYTIFHSCIKSYYLVPISPQLQRRYSTLGRLVVCLQELNSLSLLQHFGLLRELWVTMFFSCAIVKTMFYLFCYNICTDNIGELLGQQSWEERNRTGRGWRRLGWAIEFCLKSIMVGLWWSSNNKRGLYGVDRLNYLWKDQNCL